MGGDFVDEPVWGKFLFGVSESYREVTFIVYFSSHINGEVEHIHAISLLKLLPLQDSLPVQSLYFLKK